MLCIFCVLVAAEAMTSDKTAGIPSQAMAMANGHSTCMNHLQYAMLHESLVRSVEHMVKDGLIKMPKV